MASGEFAVGDTVRVRKGFGKVWGGEIGRVVEIHESETGGLLYQVSGDLVGGNYRDYMLEASGSSPTLGTERLSAIERRASAATEGPWTVETFGDGEVSLIAGLDADHPVLSAWGYDAGLLLEKDDAEFIANARLDVPALLAEVERLQVENQELRGKISQDS